jgi:bacterial/archaeal transporter family-2 protein
MNSMTFIVAALITGALVPVQVALNAQLGGVTKNPLTSGLIIFAVGALALALCCAVLRPAWPTGRDLALAPRTVWLGGLIAAGYVIAIVTITPRLGVGLTTALILVGQLATAITIDHFGAFGAVQQPVNLWRLAGLGLMVGGVVLVKSH